SRTNATATPQAPLARAMTLHLGDLLIRRAVLPRDRRRVDPAPGRELKLVTTLRLPHLARGHHLPLRHVRALLRAHLGKRIAKRGEDDRAAPAQRSAPAVSARQRPAHVLAEQR